MGVPNPGVRHPNLDPGWGGKSVLHSKITIWDHVGSKMEVLAPFSTTSGLKWMCLTPFSLPPLVGSKKEAPDAPLTTPILDSITGGGWLKGVLKTF